jgi:hypothetical protein
MTRDVLRRLVAMQPEELHFRLMSEVRKLEGRIRSAAATPAWRRTSLAAVLSDRVVDAPDWHAVWQPLARKDFAAAHRALARHFSTRRSAFPLNAQDLPVTAAAVLRDFPAAREDALGRGERMLRGDYDLLGYRGLHLGSTPDWHMDAVHGRRSPVVYWADVAFLDPAAGDHKVIWELNRHQHWLVWARAHALTGDRRFYRAFVGQLEDWLAANPPLMGINWASMLELALRGLAWLWSLEMFAPAAAHEDEPAWIIDLLLALDRQLTHIEQNLSRYFSPNTHLSGEALALYVAGCALPELAASARRVAIGREVLIQEATRQVRADGGHAELSAHYHRYSTDFYLLAARVAARAGDTAAPVFQEAARTQARYLRAICDDRGLRPQLGDDDGGQLFPICGSRVEDGRPTLAIAAVLLGEPGLRIGAVPEEAYWLCGAEARSATLETPHTGSIALNASGYFVSRTAHGDHLVFDAGPHGFLNGGHAHADALAITLTVADRPLLIDAGTATYTMDLELRDRFRTTVMHNTVILDGRSQSEPRGAFHWATRTTADAPIWRQASEGDYVEGTHAAYAPHRHTRGILSVHGVGWWILDHLLGPPTRRSVEAHWHFHPAWSVVAIDAHVCRLTQAEQTLALASTAPLTVIAPGSTPVAVHSPVYGLVEPAPVVRASLDAAAPATIGTFIPARAALTSALGIEAIPVAVHPGDGWHGCAFRVRWKGGAMVILAAVESSGLATRADTAPSDRWGTAELQTDARIALLIDYARGGSEAMLVNGATLRPAAGPALIALARRTPLVRMPCLASPMHEVEV